MTVIRTPRLRAAAALVAVAVLAACGTANPGGPSAESPRAVAPAAAPLAADPNCPDGKPVTASFDPGGSIAELRAAAQAELLTRNRLVVGTSGDVLLWGARNPQTGRLEGFDILLAQEIGRQLGIAPSAIEFRVINYGQRLPALGAEVDADNGESAAQPVDVVLHTMTINCARWDRIAFSTEYYRASQKLLVRADAPAYRSKGDRMQITDLAEGSKVCVPAASTNVETLKKYPDLFGNRLEVPEMGECLVRFQRGEVDAITGDDTVLAGFAVQDPYAHVVGDPLSQEPYGAGVNAQKHDLARFVSAVIAGLTADGGAGGWNDMYSRTMGQAIAKVPAPPKPVYGRSSTSR